VLDRPLQHRCCGLTALVVVLLDVGVARVVVDHAVQIDVAGTTIAVVLGANAGDLVSGPLKARQAGDVDMQECSGL
jgi:hypothetical protein